MIDFDQYTEYVTEGPVIHAVPLAQQPLDSLLSLEAMATGYAHIAALDRVPALDVTALDAIATAAAANYHADVITHEITSSDPSAIVARLIWVNDRPMWGVGMSAIIGAVWLYPGNHNLYRCVQAHTTQSDWTPPITPSLWVRYYDTSVVQVWVQPVGSIDAYALGTKVTHSGHIYTSLISANVWEPGTTGTETLWRCEDCTPPTGTWAVGVLYHVNDHVMHLGIEYRCLQQHTSIASWSPTSPGILGVLWALV